MAGQAAHPSELVIRTTLADAPVRLHDAPRHCVSNTVPKSSRGDAGWIVKVCRASDGPMTVSGPHLSAFGPSYLNTTCWFSVRYRTISKASLFIRYTCGRRLPGFVVPLEFRRRLF